MSKMASTVSLGRKFRDPLSDRAGVHKTLTGQTLVILVEFCSGSGIQLLLHRNTNFNFRAIVTYFG